jgi:tripartite-type tricarboxylate transporter receptor subunit TctC
VTRTPVALLALLLCAPAQALEDAASFFKGKTLRIVVGSGVGSGYDITARTLARLEYGRPFFLPPGVPPDRVVALRRAFDATVKDPAFLGEATMSRIDIDPLSGEEVQTLVGEVSQTPPDVVARVRDALGNK